MANTIKLRRSATAGSVPTTGNLALGELAMNTADGKLFMKTDDGAGSVNIAEIGAGSGGGTSVTIASSPPSSPAAGDIYWDQDDGSAYIYYIDADSTAQWVPLTPLADTPVPGSNAYKIDDISSSFNGVLTNFTINVDGSAHEPAYINATLISLGGVIQQPTTAYTISGSTISFATAPSSGVDFFGIDLAAALPIGTPNDGTVTSAKIVDGTIVNADINASAAIAGTKVSPDFGSQAITTTGIINANGKISFPLGAQAAPSIYFGSDTNTGVFSPAGDEVAITTGGTQRVTVDSSGNVGIGTSSPSSNIGSTPVLNVSGTYGGIALSSSVPSANKVEIGNYGYNTMVFATDSTERMRINSSGNVGIGTSAPASFLHVDSDNSFGNIVLSRDGGVSGRRPFGIGISGAADNHLRITASSDTTGANAFANQLIEIDSSGKVGIGTTSPEQALHVAVSSNDIARFESTTTHGSATIEIKPQSSLGRARIDVVDNASDFSISTVGTADALLIQNGGNVGIGTTSPSNLLHVKRTTTANSYAIIENTTGGNAGINIKNADGSWTLIANDALRFMDEDSSTERMRIDSSGNLLIGGTTAASADIALNANGNASFGGGNFDLASYGALSIKRTDGNNFPLFRWGTDSSYAGGGIYPDGSASFLSTVGSENGNNRAYLNPGAVDILNTSKDTTTAFRIQGGRGSASQADVVTITTNGSASFGSGTPGSSGATSTLINGFGGIETQASSGNVFIGRQGSNGVATSTINQNGTASFSGTVSAQGSVLTSDQRFKENITDANPQLADVTALGNKLRNWDWSSDAPVADKATRFLGLVAQEAETICPGIITTIARTKDGAELTPEVVVPAVYETRTVPAVLDDEGEVVEAETTEQVLVTGEQVTPATYEQLDDSYKGIKNDILIMKLLGAVAELSAKVAALEAG